MDDFGESLEGFLCPICRINFKTDGQLLAHYQDKHSDDFFKSVKDIYEKAKKKILSKEIGSLSIEQEESSSKSTPGYTRSNLNDEIGASKNHSDTFKTIRTSKMEHYAAQANNLVIRLEKLLLNLPTDPVKRKIHEQEIVPWLNEKDVKLCPGCAKSFNLLRRKHHCRLCGSIMCNECTFMLQLDTARKMTNSLIPPPLEESAATNSSSQEKTSVKPLRRSPSGASVQSVLSLDISGDSFFRVCEHCYNLLDTKQKIKEVRSQKPIICQFYEKMRVSVEEVNNDLPTYMKMFKSLSIGETVYNLSDAEKVRVKILKAAENIEIMSNKIAILGQNSENPPVGSQLMLQKAIHNAAIHYLKEKIVCLPALPKEEQVKEAQERRRLEIARRIEEENRLELETRDFDIKSSKATGNPSKTASMSTTKELVIEGGWTPEVSQSVVGIISDHPVIQQINIIKSYIKQAEAAHRFDEVAILQKNLKDLEEEFWRQTKESYLESSKD